VSPTWSKYAVTFTPASQENVCVTSVSVELGVGLLIASVAVHYGRMGIVTQAVIIIAFFFLTTPVAAHMIARAGYFTGVPLWEKSVVDELRGRYNPLPPGDKSHARDD